jgi:prepilin-type processing-associated H-X9-DG protein
MGAPLKCPEKRTKGYDDVRIYPYNKGMNFAFCDGHVKWFSSRDFITNHSARTQDGYPQSVHFRVRK